MKTFAFGAVALLAVAGAASAQVTLAAWDAFGLTGTEAGMPVSVTGPDIASVDQITRGSGLGTNSGSNSLNSNGWALGDGDDADDYFSLSFTVAPGFFADLNSLIIGSRASNTGPGQLGLFYSVDGFASPVATWSQSGTNFANNTFDLTALPDLSGFVEFRIYATVDIQADGGGAISNQGTFRIVDFFDNGNFIDTQFTGTTFVPAPGTAAVLGLAGLAGLRRRRA